MRFCDKLAKLRKNNNLSQEQFADKLNVSRSAVAKWESEAGIPDVDNLKTAAELFGVTIDYLLSEKAEVIQRFDIDIKGLKGKDRYEKKNNFVRERFKDKDIIILQAEEKTTRQEKVIDTLLGIFTDASFGTVDLINSFNNIDKMFYLIEGGNNPLVVMVTDEFAEVRECEEASATKKFTIGKWKLTKTKIKI